MGQAVFINYRGDDSDMCAALVYQFLSARIGMSKVFLDNCSIPAGEDFEQIIIGRLRESSILLAVIGPRWLTLTDSSGLRRIDSSDDWVRRELAEAFDLGIRIIPVLTDGAKMPAASALPADIAGLGRRQFVALRRRRTAEDLAQLFEKLIDLEPGLVTESRPATGAAPRHLPVATSSFVGRTDELESLDRLAVEARRGGAVVISAIGGTAGVGKTALAVQWAHRIRRSFPDGDLYVDLRGYGPGDPLEPGAVLSGFLRTLGVSGADIRQELAERSAQFRTVMDGRSMLIILDNARSEEQVRPLLPASASCLVLVTSRNSLAGLVARDGAHRIDLDLLTPAESVQLLRNLIGASRVDAEPEAAETLADRCARLPLALRVVAELAAARPMTTLSNLVTELADERTRLDLLDAGGDTDTAVRAVLSWSYHALPDEAARVFRKLGMHPGRISDAYAVAALASVSLQDAERLASILVRAHLIHERTRGRYGMHDLLRDYAAELGASLDTADDLRAAITQLFAYYLRATCAAMDVLAPRDRYRRPQLTSIYGVELPRMTSHAHALAWIEDERPNLVATIRYATQHEEDSRHDYVLQMSATLYRYFEARAYDDDALTVHTLALEYAEQSGDDRLHAQALADVGHVYERLDRYTEALGYLMRAIDLARLAHDWLTEARALNGRGATLGRLGLYDQALDAHRQALALALSDNNRSGQGHAWGHLGVIEQRVGRADEAIEHYKQALVVFRENGDYTPEGRTLNNLASAHLALGQFSDAREYYYAAARVAQDHGNRRLEIIAMNGIGDAAHAVGASAEALDYYNRALEIAVEANDRRHKAQTYQRMSHAYHALGDRSKAAEHRERAQALDAELGGPEPARTHLSQRPAQSHAQRPPAR